MPGAAGYGSPLPESDVKKIPESDVKKFFFDP